MGRLTEKMPPGLLASRSTRREKAPGPSRLPVESQEKCPRAYFCPGPITKKMPRGLFAPRSLPSKEAAGATAKLMDKKKQRAAQKTKRVTLSVTTRRWIGGTALCSPTTTIPFGQKTGSKKLKKHGSPKARSLLNTELILNLSRDYRTLSEGLLIVLWCPVFSPRRPRPGARDRADCR